MKFDEYTWPMMRPEMKPFQHQIETAKFFLMNKRAYCFSDLGTGKTLAALWATDFLFQNSKIRKVLIVSPLSTMQSVWGREIFCAFSGKRSYVVAHGDTEYRAKCVHAKADYVIINHDGIVSMEDEITAENFDVIIIDELTAFKKHTNNRSKAMIRIARRAQAVWGLTGCPTPNSPVEAFGQAKVVNPKNPYLPTFFSEFKDLVVRPLTPYLDYPTEDSSKIVHKVLQPAIRFERDKCIDIPPVQYQDVVVQMTPMQIKAYKEMKDELRIQYERGEITASNAAVKMMKLVQIAAGCVKDDDGNFMKLDSSLRDEELWNIFEETGKTRLVVFAAFRASVEHLREFFRKRGVKCELIYGSTPHGDRARFINEFQDGDLQVLILQPQSTAHGITLTAANVIVWHSLIASGEYYSQSNGRITRAGQTRKQYIMHLIGSQVEKRLLGIVSGKGNMAQGILSMFAEL